MPLIRLDTLIRAPIESCFDLSRDIDVHVRSTAKTHERAVAGVTSGLIGLGEVVTWEAVHFRLRQRLTAQITAFQRPYHFRDSQVSGAFKRFDHDHFFVSLDDGSTMMTDHFSYDSPLGILGRVADRLFLEAYMRSFLEQRNKIIKQAAESRSLG